MSETPRTPLWRMSDAQLRFIAADPTQEYNRRQFAEMILVNREQQRDNPAVFAAPTSHRRAR
jgi:hypothetical protein